MQKIFLTAEIVDVKDDHGNPTGEKSASMYEASSFADSAAAVAFARKKATKYIGDTYGVFEMTGTVVHPIPELDVTPVA